MNHVCVLLHGVETDPSTRSWVEEIQARFQRLTPIQLIPRKYGYISGPSVWFNAFSRRAVVDHEEIYFRGVPGELMGLFEDIEPGTPISIVGHSLGGYITTALLKRGIRFYRIAHLWGGTVENFDWYAVDGNFDHVRVYWSPRDERLTASAVAEGEDPELALGLMGKVGPQIAHPRVESIKTDWLHDEFMDFGPDQFRFFVDLLAWING